jgi:two-component system sensor histidine kinase KdpD
LQITQLEEGKVQLHKKLYAIDEVVNEAFHRIKTKLKNRECILNIEPSLPSIRFDKVLIEQVLVNFIENAILYTPTDTPIEIAVCCEGNNILFSVADRGSGLMMTDIYKVFEKFYRGENPLKKNGAGLGLSVCQSIVKAHNGKIWAENRKGGGAIFYFILPLHE